MENLKSQSWVRNYGFGSLLLAGAYCIIGLLGVQLALPLGYATAVFPASGIALAVLLLRSAKLWPGILLGSFCLNFWVSSHQLPDFSTLEFLPVGLAIGSGATFEALISLWFIRRWFDPKNPLGNVKNVLKNFGAVPDN